MPRKIAVAALSLLTACGTAAPLSEVTTTTSVPDSTTTTTTATTTTTTIATSTTTTTPSAVGDISCTPAPRGTESILFLPAWEAGTTRDLELVLGGERNGVFIEEQTMTPVTVTALESAPDRLALTWTQSPSQILGNEPGTAVAQLLIDQIGALTFDYELNEYREFSGIDDVAAGRDWLHQSLEAVAPGDTEAKEVLDSLTDEQLAGLLSDDLQVYHALEGYELSVGESVTFDTAVASPFGETPVTAVTTVTFVELVDEFGCAKLHVETLPDAAGLLAVIVEFMAQFGTDVPDDEVQAVAETMVMEQSATGHYDTSTGYFTRITYREYISVMTEEILDLSTITDVTP